jgi:hypothetical protein
VRAVIVATAAAVAAVEASSVSVRPEEAEAFALEDLGAINVGGKDL